jgi:hypothetical protein
MATPDEQQADNPDVPAMPYVVASWLGFSLEHIVAGLRRGSIAPPQGAPPGWLPPGADALDDAAPPEPVPDDAPIPDDAAPSGDGDAANLRETYASLVHAIDPDADDATFDALWASGGADDAARAASLDALLWRTVGEASPAHANDGPAAVAEAIARRGTHGTLVALGDEGSTALAQRARHDASALAALESGDAFAFVGRDGGAARFDPMSGERRVSDAWIDDRAKLVAWRAALAADASAAGGVAHGWRFVDRSLGAAATLVVGPEADTMNQVVFGDDDGDALEGGLAVDRLHGGRGDDTLDGGAGADYLEGGGGRDRYVFAAGDGVDVVDDVDGQGEIVVDGVTLDGDDAGIAYALADDGALTITTGHAGDAIRVAGFRDGMLGIHLAPAPEAATSAPSAGSTAIGVLKPLVTAPVDDSAHAPAREDGNESGSGAAAAQASDSAGGTVAAARSTAVDVDAWASVLKPRVTPPPSFDVAPPDVDAAAVTAADYAAALASHAGDDDDGDGLATDRHAPWYAVDDLPSAWAPPEAPPRRP